MVGFGVGRSRENILTSKYVQRQNEAKQTLYRAKEGFFSQKAFHYWLLSTVRATGQSRIFKTSYTTTGGDTERTINSTTTEWYFGLWRHHCPFKSAGFITLNIIKAHHFFFFNSNTYLGIVFYYWSICINIQKPSHMFFSSDFLFGKSNEISHLIFSWNQFTVETIQIWFIPPEGLVTENKHGPISFSLLAHTFRRNVSVEVSFSWRARRWKNKSKQLGKYGANFTLHNRCCASVI